MVRRLFKLGTQRKRLNYATKHYNRSYILVFEPFGVRPEPEKQYLKKTASMQRVTEPWRLFDNDYCFNAKVQRGT